jgi:histidyl-tRNA synthetase
LVFNFLVNPRLVRGLDYYNGVVFEFTSAALGAQNTFCGGGRYDLAMPFGLKKTVPSVGAAIGIGRLALILQESNLMPNLELPALHLILPLTTDLKLLGLMLARQLVTAGLRTDVLLEDCSFSNMMKKANRLAAIKVLIIGPDEAAQNQVIIKNMVTGEQQLVTQDQMLSLLR